MSFAVQLLAASSPDAVAMAQQTGVLGMFPTEHDYHYSIGSVPGLGIWQVQNEAIELGADFPEDGQDATPGGKAGNGGDGGHLHTLLQDLGAYADQQGGTAGTNAGSYSGGLNGEPLYAVKFGIGAYTLYSMYCGFNHWGLYPPDEYALPTFALFVTDVQFRLQHPGASAQSPGADKPVGTPGASHVDPGTFGWYHPTAPAPASTPRPSTTT